MSNVSIKKNYLYNTSYQIFTLIVPLLVTPYVSRVLGPESIGIYSFTYSIVSYFALIASLGTNTYGVKTIGATNNTEERSVIFYNLFSFRIIGSIITIILYLLYCRYVSDNGIIAYLQVFYILGVMVDVSWFFQGIQEFKKITQRNFIFKIISVLFVFLFVHSAKDLWLYILCLSGITFIGNMYMLMYLPKYIKKVPFSNIKPFTDFKSIAVLFFPTIATQIYSLIDKTLIGTLINETIVSTNGIIKVSNLENGYYEQSEKIVKMCLTVITSLGTVMIPRISYASSHNRKEEVSYYIKSSFHFIWILSIPMCFGIVAIADVFVPVFFGKGFDKVIELLPIFSLLFVFMGINSVVGNQYLISTGRQNKYMKMLIIGGLVNLLLDIVFIPIWYSIGAAIASVIGEIVIATIGCIYMIHARICSFKEIFQPSIKCIIAGISMLCIIRLLYHLIPTINLFILLITIIVGMLNYFIVLILLKDSLVTNEITKLMMRVKNRYKLN